jgi:hypothetical protein
MCDCTPSLAASSGRGLLAILVDGKEKFSAEALTSTTSIFNGFWPEA